MLPIKSISLKPFLAPLLGGAMLTMSVLSITMAPAAWANEDPLLRVITVTGQGSESIPTTLTQVELGVEVQGATAEEVQRQVAERSAQVMEVLRSQNVQKLQTTGVRLNPQYSYDSSPQQLTGYIGANTVSFRIPTNNAGTVIDDAIAAGANQVYGLSFVAEESALTNARQVALKEATADAQQQANTVLSTLNLTPQEIVTIQINGANSPPIYLGEQRFAEAAGEAAASTPVVGGEQTVDATVTLQIRY
ncbi:SIMPL domain-containing protein [Leptothoe sp. PORK10 BA2]|uniref:SIMPL domain-containing protein n=1 Tax=Leptothoe sp. PORK10 BA2 TaxID=3110254 RepID=UPI002B1F80E2|nr:SIMPL domain-containing protein [Leptothoe sp. PORK10 BA2]MEA5464803.1 SIMPL domain-containing protein [Leptothoe sp. PORK10 BA2]